MPQPSCVVVGAGPGLGLAIARRFARGGFDVALVGRHRQRLDALCEALLAEGHRAAGFAADAGDTESLAAAFADIAEWNGETDVLVYNAASLVADAAPDVTAQVMTDAMAVNLGSAVCAVNCVLPGMRARGRGTILMTGGGLALEPYPDWTALGAGKAALRAYAIALHKALVPEHIHAAVIAVCGVVERGGPFDPDRIAEEYWRLHAKAEPDWRRELVYLPDGADPFYNDPTAAYRTTSLPLKSR
jgi:NAD(P)-dependent dehydrogenase (short-subunit alcohol dehydrogenase family)